MNKQSYRDTWAEVSLEAIKLNVQQFKSHMKETTKFMAVVKADGYGHGAVEVSKASIEAGAEYLSVALLDEAVELREAGFTLPILVLGYTSVHAIEKAVTENIALTIFSHETLDEIIYQAAKLKKTATVHIKIDTGMSRIGVTTHEDALILAKKCLNAPYIYLEGVFTHFANADCEDPTYTVKQFESFMSYIKMFNQNDIIIPIKHCCNSAATMLYPDMHLDMVRVGIALYGLYPDVCLKGNDIVLVQAMSLKTKIAHIKTVPAGQPIGYGCTFAPSKDSVIATLPIGYADGVSRRLSNRAEVLTHGRVAPITGRVCMDQMMIDVSQIPNSKIGDEVAIFGHNQDAFHSVEIIAALMETNNHEVVCGVSKRVPRVYVTKQQQEETNGQLSSSI
jgi:alanine racemase